MIKRDYFLSSQHIRCIGESRLQKVEEGGINIRWWSLREKTVEAYMESEMPRESKTIHMAHYS
jgi:hypothetical protein